MAGENEFLAFATGVGANVMTQADYEVAPFLADGFEAGIAESQKLNKVWRQSSFIAAVVAQFVATITNQDVLDDGDEANLVSMFTNAVQVAAGVRPAVLEPLSTARTILASEYAVGFNRAAAPAPTPVELPADAAEGQEFVIEDVFGNAAAYPITVTAPGGGTISGLSSFVLNINRQSQSFRFYSGTTWSLSS